MNTFIQCNIIVTSYTSRLARLLLPVKKVRTRCAESLNILVVRVLVIGGVV